MTRTASSKWWSGSSIPPNPPIMTRSNLRNLLRTGISESAITGSVDTRVAVLDAMGADERSAT